MSEKNGERKKEYFSELDAARKLISEHETNTVLNEGVKQKLVESVSLLNSFFNSPGAMRGVVGVEGNDIRHITDNSIAAEFFGRTQESMSNMLASQMGVDQEIIDIWINHYEESKHRKQQINFEYEHKVDKQSHFFSVTVNYLGESERGFSRYTYVLFDITENKQAQKALQKAHGELEQKVNELTKSNERLMKEIEGRRKIEKELETKSHSLKEINIALKVLLEKRNEDKEKIEENILSNVKELVDPYLEKLKRTVLNDRQMSYVSVLESNLNNIISPFSYKLSSKFLKLTPSEIQIANLVKQGRSMKEIAELTSLSINTVATHRRNIRKKLGLGGKKSNLRSHLLSIQQ